MPKIRYKNEDQWDELLSAIDYASKAKEPEPYATVWNHLVEAEPDEEQDVAITNDEVDVVIESINLYLDQANVNDEEREYLESIQSNIN